MPRKEFCNRELMLGGGRGNTNWETSASLRTRSPPSASPRNFMAISELMAQATEDVTRAVIMKDSPFWTRNCSLSCRAPTRPRCRQDYPEKYKGLGYHELNAMLNLAEDANGMIPGSIAIGRLPVRYFLQHVNTNTVFFHHPREAGTW